MRAPYRNRFDPARDFVVRKPMTVSGRRFGLLEAFDKTLVSERRLRQLFSQRTVVYAGEAEPGSKLSAAEAADTFRGKRAALAKEVLAKRAKEQAEKAKKAEALKAEKAAQAETAKAAKAAAAEEKKNAKEAERVARQEAAAAAEQAAADADTDATPPPPSTETVHGDDAVRVARAAVEIPSDWATLPWPKRLQLAAQLTTEKVKNGEDAAKAITEELQARGNP